MAERPSYDELAQRLAALEDLLRDPSALKQRMEFGWDPRGGEPRIVTDGGKTLPYQGAIQFKGATVKEDPKNQRVVVTSASGMKGDFSPDDVVSDAERIQMVLAADGVRKWVLDTETDNAGARKIITLLSDNASSRSNLPRVMETSTIRTAGPDATQQGIVQTSLNSLQMTQTAGNIDSSFDVVAKGTNGNTNRVQLTMRSAADGTSQALLEAVQAKPGNAWGAEAKMTSLSQDARAVTFINARQNARFTVPAAVTCAQDDSENRVRIETGGVAGSASGFGRDLLRDDGFSHWLRHEPGSGSSPSRRVTRGLFIASSGSVAAGATATVTVAAALFGTADQQSLMGSLQGASGVEKMLWSWAPGVGNDVVLSFTNTSGAALTAELRFMTVGNA